MYGNSNNLNFNIVNPNDNSLITLLFKELIDQLVENVMSVKLKIALLTNILNTKFLI